MNYRVNSDGSVSLTFQSRWDRILTRGDDTTGWIPAAIAAGSAALPFITGLFSACKAGQACGLSGINAFGQQVMQTLAQIEQMLTSGLLAPGQAASEAGRVAATLSDSNYVYQAKRGNDAAALQNFKAQAAAKVQQITALASQLQQRAAESASNPLAGISGGSGSSLLLLGGLGLVAMLALRKRNASAS